jgi:predicted metal-dependent phosphoesterase TrpH
MKLGLHIPETDWQGGAPRLRQTLGEVVESAGNAGFDLIAVADHV